MSLGRDLPVFLRQSCSHSCLAVELAPAMMKRSLKMNLFPVLQLFHLSQRRYHGPLPELTIVQPATRNAALAGQTRARESMPSKL